MGRFFGAAPFFCSITEKCAKALKAAFDPVRSSCDRYVALMTQLIITGRPILDGLSDPFGVSGDVIKFEVPALPSNAGEPLRIALGVPGFARGVPGFASRVSGFASRFTHSVARVAMRVLNLTPLFVVQPVPVVAVNNDTLPTILR